MQKQQLASVLAATVAALVAVSGTAHGQEAFETAMRKCAAIEDEDARLTCFDALATLAPDAAGDNASRPQAPAQLSETSGAKAMAAPAAAGAAAAAVASEGEGAASDAGVQPLTDDVGMERVDPEQKKNPEYAARVVRCEKNRQSGQLYFFLDNEQVWKQANYRRMSVGDCQFDVRLSKDAFGYELYIPSKDRKIRVTRLR